MANQREEPRRVVLEGRRLTRKTPKTLRKKREWGGGIVRAKSRVSNCHGMLPAGSYYQIIQNYGGLELLSLPCRCCGFRLHVSKVGEHEVDYLGHPEGTEDRSFWHRGQSEPRRLADQRI